MPAPSKPDRPDQLAKLDAEPPDHAPGGFLHIEGCQSITSLIAARRDHSAADLDRFKASVRAQATVDTRSLVVRIATTSDALKLWAIHATLDGRGLPPALLWPANDDALQSEFVTFAADVFWFARRVPDYQTVHRGWRGALLHPRGDPKWHATAHQQFVHADGRVSLAHWVSKGLGLSDAHRGDLMSLPTRSMQARRRKLQPERFAAIQGQLLGHTMDHRDKSGKRTPDAIATRRAALWRTFVLSGQDQTATTRNWKILTGESLSRQALRRQFDIVDVVLR